MSHTADKEGAFSKISTFVKPGGYLIFGDPNKAGGFQNMLQRYACYKFAKTNQEMVDVCEFLYKEDIDRSEKAVPRTRRAIIYDRWVIQSQDDPSVAEVANWTRKAGLRLYSSYPNVLLPVFGDSYLHRNKFDVYSVPETFAIAEAVWATQTDYDAEFLPAFASKVRPFAASFADLTTFVANFSLRSNLDVNRFSSLTQAVVDTSRSSLDVLAPLRDKIGVFLKEAEEFVAIVEKGDIKTVRRYLEGTKYFSRGACGVRHVDFIAYKPNNS